MLADATWVENVTQTVTVLSESMQTNLSEVTKALNKRADALKDAEEQMKKELETRRSELQEKEEAMRAEIEEERKQLRIETEKLEAEKEAMKGVHTFQSGRLKLDVGGHKFTTSRTTLTSQPDSMLAAMFSGRHTLVKDEEGAYFIDRDGTHFRFILNYLRDGQLGEGTLPEDRFQLQEILRESDYYQLTELAQYIRVKLMPVVTQQDIQSLLAPYPQYQQYGHSLYDEASLYEASLYVTHGFTVDGTASTFTPSHTIGYSCMDRKNLANINFAGTDFSNGFSFKGSFLRCANFSSCYFGGTVYFNDADLTDATFIGCGGLLSGIVHFNGANLHGTKFEAGVKEKLTM